MGKYLIWHEAIRIWPITIFKIPSNFSKIKNIFLFARFLENSCWSSHLSDRQTFKFLDLCRHNRTCLMNYYIERPIPL